MLSKALHSDSAPLASHYGAIVGLGELGHEVGHSVLEDSLSDYYHHSFKDASVSH
jgi:TAF6 C-terminal HEAT repeat domain